MFPRPLAGSRRVPEPAARGAGDAGRRARGLRRLLAAAVVAGSLVVAAAADGAPALTAAQQQQLARGEIVVLDELPPGASPDAGGGTAVAVVRAPVERVWGVLTDYPGHPRYYPGVLRAEVLERDGPRMLVRYAVQIGFFTFHFHMNKVADPARHRIDWQLAEDRPNGLLRENSGYWLVDARKDGSLVTYAMAVRTYLPGFLSAASQRDSLVETIVKLRGMVAKTPGGAADR